MSTVNTHDYGDLVRLTGTFRDALTDALLDPTVVKVTIREPDGTTTTYQYGVDDEVVRSSLGVYYVEVPIDQIGMHHYRWYSTGVGQASEQWKFNVQATEITT